MGWIWRLNEIFVSIASLPSARNPAGAVAKSAANNEKQAVENSVRIKGKRGATLTLNIAKNWTHNESKYSPVSKPAQLSPTLFRLSQRPHPKIIDRRWYKH